MLANGCRARNYWVSGCTGHLKMVMETQFLDQGFCPPGIVRPTDSPKHGFSDRKPRNYRENQNTEADTEETQILIVISNPGLSIFLNYEL